MRWQTAAYVVPLLLGGLLAAHLAWEGWRRRAMTGGVFFALLMAGVSLWSIAYACELNAANLGVAVFWSNLLWLGAAIVHTPGMAAA